MAKEITGYRYYYDKDFEFLLKEELEIYSLEFSARTSAKRRHRMYANLFTRDMRKELIKEDSACVACSSIIDLELDHIIPIAKGGKNERENLQILCSICNLKKRAK